MAKILPRNARENLYAPALSGGVSGVVNGQFGLRGFTDGSSDQSGYVGEALRSTGSVSLSNGVYADVCHIDLPAGDFDLSFVADFLAVGATPAGSGVLAGIGTVSGNSATGLVNGDNVMNMPTMPTNNSHISLSLPAWRVNSAAAATYYLKALAAFSTNGVSVAGRFSARRMR